MILLGYAMIRVESVGKTYRRGLRRDISASLCDIGKRALSRLTGVGCCSFPDREPFWALRDVSFEVHQGECFGVVGRNGSGKSTLLKLICGVSRPTAGRVVLFGRPTLLAAMGVGMSGELTGRENIYINGGILGATDAEIRKLFDEIVAFAELERFLDTPVKFYSTGMYARLAFSVASHMPGEILLLDEVLVVGDQGFQQKCGERLKRITKSGDKTVMIVAHSTAYIRQLCQRCLLLDKGEALACGDADKVVKRYETLLAGTDVQKVRQNILPAKANQQASIPPHSSAEYIAQKIVRGDAVVINRIAVLNAKQVVSNTQTVFSPFRISVEYVLNTPLHTGRVIIGLLRSDGVLAIETADHLSDKDLYQYRNPGKYKGELSIPQRLLAPGEYRVLVRIMDYEQRKILAMNDDVSFVLTQYNRLDSPFEAQYGRAVSECQLSWVTQIIQ